MPKTILVFSSNPRGTTVLDLSREIRDIKEGLRRSEKRNQFKIEICLAVRPIDLRRAIIDIKPQIVHFCGHGEKDLGLCLEDENGKLQIVSTEALSDLFRIFSKDIECVLINTCHSQEQAEAIAEHVNYVIGMSQEIKDEAAIQFAIGFYDAISAGESVEKSFEIGKLAILLEMQPDAIGDRKFVLDDVEAINESADIPQHLIPVLYKNDNLGIQVEYTDPEEYTGQVWTKIVPENNNIDKIHLINIEWGNYYWQEAMKIPKEGILLIYEKRNQDLSTRIITVFPADEYHGENRVIDISKQTKIFNGYNQLPLEIGLQKQINQGWYQRKQNISLPSICSFNQLKEALYKAKFCDEIEKSHKDFAQAKFVVELDDGYYVYHLDHYLGGQHLYVTSRAKSDNFVQSYDSIILAYHGAFFGRSQIFKILEQLRGS